MKYGIAINGIERTMYVRRFRFPSQKQSAETFHKADGQFENVSVWQTTTEDRRTWSIIICGQEDDTRAIVDWSVFDDAVEVPVAYNEGIPFLMRRVRILFDAFMSGSTEDVQQRAHYGTGVRLTATGDTVAAPPPPGGDL